MNTNFFKQIAQMNITGDLHLIISKGAENSLVVSVMLNNEQCGDKAKNLISPLTFNATPQEFDEGFFEKITEPIEKVSGLMINMERFLKQLEEVKKQSAMEREKSTKEKKEKEEREKKYKEEMQKVDKLEKNGKYRDAWMKVPDPALFPEQAEAIRKRRTALSGKFSPDLFGVAEAVTPEVREDGNSYCEIPEDETGEDDENLEDDSEAE